ncbi:uncharacterized protein [Watersipora subatra]|uniref:uncharacterized protein n=1 Tax=Watersipora subatra TaxID=2589382 RepID=UPI00355B33BC
MICPTRHTVDNVRLPQLPLCGLPDTTAVHEPYSLTLQLYKPNVVQNEGKVNLAANKMASQSGTVGTHQAKTAVNGDINDFSQTSQNQEVNWWAVDLGAKYSIGGIKIFNREGFYERLEKVSILTSNKTNPSDPSLSSVDWTRIIYREPSYPAALTHNFDPPVEGQQVAILNTHKEGLALAEVEVYDFNYVRDKNVGQSTTKSSHPASYAVDGDLSKYSSTRNRINSWWKVNIGRQILFRAVKVFVRDVCQCMLVSPDVEFPEELSMVILIDVLQRFPSDMLVSLDVEFTEDLSAVIFIHLTRSFPQVLWFIKALLIA